MKRFTVILIAFLSLLTQVNIACTSFVLNRGDNFFLAKNLDWPVGEGMIVVNNRGVYKSAFTEGEKKISWTSRYGSISFNQFGKEFPLGGMNEAGLVIEELNSWGQTPAVEGKYILNEFQWVQYCLDNYSGVDELVQAQKDIVIVPLFINLHYIVADSIGNVAIIEFYNGQAHIYKGNELPYPILCNNHYENSLKYLGNFKEFGGTMDIPDETTSNERFVQVASMIMHGNEKECPSFAFEILNTVRQEDTQWSIVYDVKNKRIQFNTRDNTAIIDLNTISFSFYKPCRFRDINDKSNTWYDLSAQQNTEFLTSLHSILLLYDISDIPLSMIEEMAFYGNDLISDQDKIPNLYLNSSPYENGFRHGWTYRESIRRLVNTWEDHWSMNFGIPARKIIDRFLESTNYIPAIKKWTPGMYEEIKGISNGSGIDFNTILAFNLVDEMWTNSNLINEPHHCTSMGINNYKKDGGSNIIAQNIDIPPFYHGYEIILNITDPKTGERTLVSTFAGFIGANGMNQHLGVCVNALLDLKSSSEGLPVCCVVRGILNQDSYDKAESFIRNIKHASGQNYIIGSHEKIASYECSADRVCTFWPDSSQNYTLHTNRSLTNDDYKETYKAQIKDAYGVDPKKIRFNCPRYQAILEFITSSQEIDTNSIMTALSKEPVMNKGTWLSTIMEFTDNKSTMSVYQGYKKSTSAQHFKLFER